MVAGLVVVGRQGAVLGYPESFSGRRVDTVVVFQPEGVEGLAYSMPQTGVSAVGEELIAAQVEYQGLVPCEVSAYYPAPVVGADYLTLDLELDTGVLDGTYVHEVGGESGCGGHSLAQQHVGGLTVIVLDGTGQPVVEEAEVDTYVPGLVPLPGEVGVLGLVGKHTCGTVVG